MVRSKLLACVNFLLFHIFEVQNFSGRNFCNVEVLQGDFLLFANSVEI